MSRLLFRLKVRQRVKITACPLGHHPTSYFSPKFSTGCTQSRKFGSDQFSPMATETQLMCAFHAFGEKYRFEKDLA